MSIQTYLERFSMVFWRRQRNDITQDQQDREDRLLHRAGDPAIEPPTEYDPVPGERLTHELNENEAEIIDEISEIPVLPHGDDIPLFPVHRRAEQLQEAAIERAEGGWLSRLASGLTKSSTKIGQGLTDLLTKHKLDAPALERLEEVLIEADLGPATARKIVKVFADSSAFAGDVSDHDVRLALAGQIAALLEPVTKPLVIKKPENGPFVILVAGVNGVGKTTTIGKLAKIMHDGKHHKVMMAAGDTFRAAAVEQLQVWGQRAHTPVITRDVGADAAALAYEAYDQAKREGYEVLLIDTAGRLHNKDNLMAELQKIVRVLKKHDAALPHEVLLVLDGTTGQNAFAQVKTFQDMVNVTGLIVTKLDGSAKGGVVVGLADQFRLPIYAVGVGEQAEDLQPFTAEGFARSLVGVA